MYIGDTGLHRCEQRHLSCPAIHEVAKLTVTSLLLTRPSIGDSTRHHSRLSQRRLDGGLRGGDPRLHLERDSGAFASSTSCCVEALLSSGAMRL